MFHSCILSSLIFISLTAVDASPLSPSTGKGTLDIETRCYNNSISSIVERDIARINHGCWPSASSVSAVNNGSFYTAKIGVGFPPTNYTVLIDSGSSDTWVGALNPYVKTKTSHDTGHSFHIKYGGGNATGEIWNDIVTLSPSLVVQQSIGVANSSYGVAEYEVDGLLAIGPTILSSTTGVDTLPTVMDNLYTQGKIAREVLGIGFTPYCEANGTGKLTFGGYDESAITAPVFYTPLTTRRQASHSWAIDLAVSYGSHMILQNGTGMVDSGSTLTYLRSDAFQAYQSKTGAISDDTTGLYTISSNQYNKLQPLTVHIGGKPFKLTPNAQIVPRSVTNDTILLAVSDMKPVNVTEWPFDVVLGYSFLERYYSVLDTTKKRFGLASTPYTYSVCN